jgi:lipopolysaccharide transport system permease protein
MSNLLKNLWAYRHFVYYAVVSELRGRVARSRIGFAWLIAQPLAQAAIFAIVLSSVLSARLPNASEPHAYAVYLLAGMAGWSLFADVVSRCTRLFVESGSLMKKVAFPRICLPVIAIGSALVQHAFLLCATLVVVLLVQGSLPWTSVFLPLLSLAIVALAAGLGLVLGVVNVFVRDVEQTVPVVLQLLFWFTPIVYVPEVLPKPLSEWLAINPIAPAIRGMQDALAFDRVPDWQPILLVVAGSALLLVAALALFRRASPEMVDVL